MTAPSWKGIEAKKDRAVAHAKTLDREVGAFLNSKPYSTERKIYDDGRKWIYIAKDVKPLPSFLAPIFGDWAHNLRTTLDYIVNELVIANGARPNRRTTFPVLVQEPPQGLRVYADGGTVAPEVLTEIHELQPYSGWKGNPEPIWHPIHLIHELDRIDKHRNLALLVTGVSGYSYSLPGFEEHPFIDYGPLVEGEPMAEVVWSVPKPETYTDPTFPIEVVLNEPPFGNDRIGWVTETINGWFANDILPRFGPFFPT